MSKAIEQSVKRKLSNIARNEGVAFNILLETLFLERFLVRLSTSKYKDNFIFKGGMCLHQYLNIGRETRDLDFLLHKLASSTDNVKNVFEEVASIKHDDGFEFDEVTLSTLAIEHKKYPGYRISLNGNLGQIKQKITVDVGVGDVVRPRLLEVELMKDKGALFEEGITLSAYPPEYIFSEKLEAIIYLDEVNSRMKDFHDCLQIIKDESIEKNEFKDAILETFANRGTTFTYIPNHEEKLGAKWGAFVRKNKGEVTQLNQVIVEINEFLKRIGL